MASVEDMQRQFEVEQYYYNEAQLLDEHRLEEWLALFCDDLRYWVPSRQNRSRQDADPSLSAGRVFSLFDDTKTTLGWRVRQQMLVNHWAENPLSRTRHLITNVRIRPMEPHGELEVRSNFMCYRNRMQDEVDIWVGERVDLLRPDPAREWQIARRTVILDQSVVLSKNLSVFL